MQPLLDKLKAADKRMIRISLGVQIMYLVMIPIYAAFYIWNPGGEMNDFERLGGGIIVLSLICFALLFRSRIKRLKQVDYAIPTRQMLSEAVTRFSLWNPEIKWALAAAFVMDIGLSVSHYEEGEGANPWSGAIEMQYVFIPAIIIGVIVGIVLWHYRYKPLRDNARKLLQELDAE